MTDRKPTVVVTADDTLPGIIARLTEASQGGHPIDLVVPIDSALLLTAREFRHLKNAIDEQRLAVRLRSADPLRLQLAERLGYRVQALPRPRVPVAAAAAAPPLVAVPEVAAAEAPTNGHAAVETLEEVAAPILDPATLWPDPDDASAAAEAAPVTTAEDERVAPALANPPRRWLPVAAALVALVVGTFFAIRFALPQAVIRYVPKTAPVAESLMFDVTDDGKPLHDGAAFALAAQPRQIEVTWTGSAPVSGVRVEPDGTASGPIELRNTAAEPLVVAAGTKVSTEDGVEFTFSEDVTVPAADPATGNPGAATGTVTAAQAGSGGNVANGEIGGRLPNGIYYSNRMQSTDGGSDKEFPVVAQKDLDGLSAAAKVAAPALAADAVAAAQAGAAVLPSSVKVTGQQDAFDRKAGDDAESVSLRSTLTLQVLTYDGELAQEGYEPVLTARLNDAAPSGFAVTPKEIVFADPAQVEAGDRGVRLQVDATADAAAVLGDAERQALATALAGASPEEAQAILAKSPEIASYTIDYHPSWLPAQMPNNTGRIIFEPER